MPIKCLMFDLDDTIVDDTENRRGAFLYFLNQFNLTYTEDYFQQWLKFDSLYWDSIFQTLEVPSEYKKTGKLNAEYLRGMRFPIFFKKEFHLSPLELQEIFKDGLKQRIIPLPDTVETIKTLSKEYPIYIATNSDSNVGKLKIQKIGLENYIQGIFSADLTSPAATKSDLEYYSQLLEFAKMKNANECLMTGDNYKDDILIPNKAGYQTCWLHPVKEENVICDYQIKELKHLLKYLSK